jgi:hypothetical protein
VKLAACINGNNNNVNYNIAFTQQLYHVKLYTVSPEQHVSTPIVKHIRNSVPNINIRHARFGEAMHSFLIAIVNQSQLQQLTDCINSFPVHLLKQQLTLARRDNSKEKFCRNCLSTEHFTSRRCRSTLKCSECSSTQHTVAQCNNYNNKHQCSLCKELHYETQCPLSAYQWTVIAQRKTGNVSNSNSNHNNQYSIASPMPQMQTQFPVTVQQQSQQQQHNTSWASRVRAVSPFITVNSIQETEMNALRKHNAQLQQTVESLSNEMSQLRALIATFMKIQQNNQHTDSEMNAIDTVPIPVPQPNFALPAVSVQRAVEQSTQQTATQNDSNDEQAFTVVKPGRKSASLRSIALNKSLSIHTQQPFQSLEIDDSKDDNVSHNAAQSPKRFKTNQGRAIVSPSVASTDNDSNDDVDTPIDVASPLSPTTRENIEECNKQIEQINTHKRRLAQQSQQRKRKAHPKSTKYISYQQQPLTPSQPIDSAMNLNNIIPQGRDRQAKAIAKAIVQSNNNANTANRMKANVLTRDDFLKSNQQSSTSNAINNNNNRRRSKQHARLISNNVSPISSCDNREMITHQHSHSVDADSGRIT